MKIEKLKNGIEKLKKLEKAVLDVTEKYNCTVYDENSLHSTFIFHKNGRYMLTTTYPVQFAFDYPGDVTLKEYTRIKKSLSEPFRYSAPTKDFYVEIGEVDKDFGYSYDYDGDLEEYETENFIALMGFDPCPSHLQDNQGLLQDIFEEGEVKEHFQIEYDHITKEFAIETDDEYADTEDKILEIRISNPVIDEVFTILHKELTGKFPKEVPLQNNEDNRVELLQNDYKKLYNHMKDFKVDKEFVKEPSLHFVFMDTATTRYKAAGLYMFAQGFNLGYSPDKQEFTFNTYEAKTELRLKGSLLSRAFQHDEVINHYELHQYEKQDTFKFFKELVDTHIRPSLKSREKIQVDIRLDAGIIDNVKVISYDLILLYRDKKLIGTIQCEKINKTDTTNLVNGVNELIVEIIGGRKSPQLRLDQYFTKEEFKQSVIDNITDEDIVNMFKTANLTKDGDVNDEKVD